MQRYQYLLALSHKIRSTTICTLLGTICGLLLVTTASANIAIQFTESAPKDSFTITNNSQCTVHQLSLSIDLSNSVGKLIFDTAERGAGVEVFQPFNVKQGDITLTSPSVNDGQSILAILIKNIAPKASASFTIDVDDTLQNSSLGNIRVTGSEIEGGEVHIKDSLNTSASARFDNNSQAIISMQSCM